VTTVPGLVEGEALLGIMQAAYFIWQLSFFTTATAPGLLVVG
jgi:hypothetical protein